MNIHYFDKKGKKNALTLNEGATVAYLIKKASNILPKEDILFASVNDTFTDLSHPLKEGDIINFFDFSSKEGKEVFWHSSAHILAQAVIRKFPEAQPTIGPAIENGFYYDFANLSLSEHDLKGIEEEMEKICEENHTPQRILFPTKTDAKKHFQNNPYKLGLIDGFEEGEITAYSQGEFFDLCRGPHLPSLNKIKALKVLKTSGAYWKGDSKNTMLTRIYGISFPDKKQLREYLFFLEEAKKRDHKILGPKLDIFSLHEEAPGMPFWHPKGVYMWNKLIDFWRECHIEDGYIEINTPTIMSKDLWIRSGHWANYRENMFTTESENKDFAIKPMNCPGGMIYYKEKQHSYRELPLRVTELGKVFRYEHSGALSGLFRVRSFHVDDAHIFLTLKDVQSEVLKVLDLVDKIYSVFGLKYSLELSTRPESNTIGTDEEWETTTRELENALKTSKKPYKINEGDGAFYGPKIDLKVHDALNRIWQCGTIQLDMSLPERFDIEYTDSDGTRKRPLMIHRAVLGSVERFIGSLIEFFAGKFPLWISPSQIKLVPVAERHIFFAQETAHLFRKAGFLVEIDQSNESVSKKIRQAQMEQNNYILTIGDREVENNTISLRTRDNVVHGEMPISSFVAKITQERDSKALTSPFTKEKN